MISSHADLLHVRVEDLVFLGLDRLPAPGEEVRTTRFATSIGGGAVITAVAAARLGLKVEVASGLSDAAVARLRSEKVAVTNLRRRGEPHAISAALSTGGERAFVTFDGVNTKLEPRLARAIRSTRASHVHLAFYPRNCARWARRVKALWQRGITISADFGWNDHLAADPALPALCDALDIVFINEREAALYAGVDRLDDAPGYWRARPAIVVIKLGSKAAAPWAAAGS